MTRVAGVGDIVLMRRLVHAQPTLLDVLREADVTCGNLEVALTDEVNPQKEFVLRGEAALVEDLAALGVRVVGLANNHTADHGWPALRGVAERVAQSGMTPIGTGETPDDAWRPVLVEEVAFVCASCVAPFAYGGHLAGVETEADAERLLAAVAEARKLSPRVVVMMHWGVPHHARAEAGQRELARRLAAAGASAVFGCHPHTLQGIEVIDGVPVFYGLGSLVFQYDGARANTFERDAAVALVDLDDDGRARTAEVVIGRIGPEGEAVRAHPARVERVLELMVAAGGDWGASLQQHGDRVTVQLA